MRQQETTRIRAYVINILQTNWYIKYTKLYYIIVESGILLAIIIVVIKIYNIKHICDHPKASFYFNLGVDRLLFFYGTHVLANYRNLGSNAICTESPVTMQRPLDQHYQSYYEISIHSSKFTVFIFLYQFQRRTFTTICPHSRRRPAWTTWSSKRSTLSTITRGRCRGSTLKAPGLILPIICHR